MNAMSRLPIAEPDYDGGPHGFTRFCLAMQIADEHVDAFLGAGYSTLYLGRQINGPAWNPDLDPTRSELVEMFARAWLRIAS